MNPHTPHLYLFDDPVSETLALFRSQPFPLMAILIVVVFRRLEDEVGLHPAIRLMYLATLQRVLLKALNRAA